MGACIALLLIGSTIFALTVITMMLAQYGGHIAAALAFEPMPRRYDHPRFRAGQMIGGRSDV